mmetsp:Transcript_29659/g.61919  ORF Transcript_29659/g.61919 Transcript_29659/m.61919 type:complete len:124 (-) Transcript_29659:123-494(-)
MQAKGWDPLSPDLDKTTTTGAVGDGRSVPRVENGNHRMTQQFFFHGDAAVFFSYPRCCLMQARGGALAPQNIGLRQALGGETCISKGGNKLGEHYNPGWGGIFLGREYRVQGCDDPPRTGSWD